MSCVSRAEGLVTESSEAGCGQGAEPASDLVKHPEPVPIKGNQQNAAVTSSVCCKMGKQSVNSAGF